MKRCVVFLLILLLFCGCMAPPAAEISAPEQETEMAVPSAEENIFLADYDDLWSDLNANYPFFPVLEAQEIDVEAIRVTYRAYAEKVQTTGQFMDILDRMFGQLRCFAHLSLIRRERYDLLLKSAERLPSPWLQVLEEPVTAQVYADMEPAAAQNGGEMPTMTCEYLPEVQAAYIFVPSMDPSGAEQDQKRIAEFLETLPPVEHIIFDVTGNTGGSTKYWEEVLLKPFGGSWQAKWRLYYQDAPINHQYFGGELQPVGKEKMPEFAAELGAAFYRDVVLQLDFGEPQLTNGADAKRWVLTDGRGYSATEQFAAFCKLTGWATLVGERTGGDGLGGQPLLLPLKRTGLLVYFSTAMAANPDGSLNALQGVLPDHVCLPKKNQTPLELCLEQIKAE